MYAKDTSDVTTNKRQGHDITTSMPRAGRNKHVRRVRDVTTINVTTWYYNGECNYPKYEVACEVECMSDV